MLAVGRIGVRRTGQGVWQEMGWKLGLHEGQSGLWSSSRGSSPANGVAEQNEAGGRECVSCTPLRPIAVPGRAESLCLSTSAVQRAAAPPSFTASAPLARSDLDRSGQGLLSTAAFKQETAGAPVTGVHNDRAFQIGAAAHNLFLQPITRRPALDRSHLP
ncbi:hypothetical protein OPT61_g3733 [Boeremia exigua]|uniref:Uncharacterized protein n=1 Tax=Boeremia exigua TaxID=749465 RepID=A0ACC2IGT5_9PLEO|nr:hypothetical protein OPT61_g3733 [Boeremia exigua]